jgi:hypothetical protein
MAILNAIERLQAKAPAAGQKVPPPAPAVARCSGRDALPASGNYVSVIPPAGGNFLMRGRIGSMRRATDGSPAVRPPHNPSTPHPY